VADEELGTGSVTITLDDSAADAGLTRLADRIERSLDQAARDGARRMERQLNAAIRRITPLTTYVDLDVSEARAELDALAGYATTVRVTPEIDRDQFINAIQAALVGATVAVNTIPNLDGFDAAIRAHNAPTVTVDVDADTDRAERAISGIGRALSSLGGLASAAASFAALGTAAAGAATGVVALGAALAPAAGLIAAGPAVILGYQAALGGLKLALTGVGEAFSAGLTGDADEFNKAIENLSPAAQAAAKEVRALKPEFEALRATVQDSFFEQIEGDITRTAEALEGPLKKGLSGVATEWGNAAEGVLGYVQGSAGVSNVTSILGGAESAVDGLAGTTNKLTAGFLQVAASVSDAFGERFGAALAGAGQSLGGFLQNAASSGQAVAWVEGALAVFQQLGAIVGNVGSILSSVFGQAAAAGGGLLANIEMLTGQLADFLASAEGTQILESIFSLLAGVSGVLGAALGAVLTVVKAVAPAFTQIVNAITPILPVVASLISQLASGLAPIIAQVAGVIADVLTAALDAILPILPPLVDAFLTLVKAVSPLIPILGDVLSSVITALAPLLLTLAETVGTIATALAPLIAQLIEGFAPILEAIAPIIARLVEAFAPLITALVDALLPILPPIIDAFLAVLGAILPLIDPIIGLVEALAPLVVLIVEAIAPIIQFAAEVIKWLTLTAVVPVIEGIVKVLTKIIEKATDVITSIVDFVTDFKDNFTDMKDSAIETVSEMWAKVADFFEQLWSDASGWVKQLWEDVVGYFSDLYDNATETVSNIWTDIVQYFRDLKDDVVFQLAMFVIAAKQKFDDAKDRIITVVSTTASNVLKYFKELPGRIKTGLGDLGTTLYNAGKDLLNGLKNGVISVAQNLINAVRNTVSDAVESAKNFLGIASPSKLFYEIGQNTGQGLVNGIDSMGAAVTSASKQMASSVAEGFTSPIPSVMSTAAGVTQGWKPGDPFDEGHIWSRESKDRAIANGAKRRVKEAAGLVANITINEVGDGEATANRVLNRLASASGLALVTG